MLKLGEISSPLHHFKLKDIIERYSNPVEVIPNQMYTQIGIRSHGKGIFIKDEVTGEELGNKRIFWLEPDCFIVNIVFAWERAVARTTSNLEGLVASHRFPMYKVDPLKVNLDYFTRLFLTKKGQLLLELASPGGAGRNKTLGQKDFLNLEIELPSLEMQKYISDFLNRIDKKIQLQKEKINLLKQQKKGYMKKIFSQELRFKNDFEEYYPDWQTAKLEEFLTVHTNYNKENLYNIHDVLSVSGDYGVVNQIEFQGRSFAGASLEKYKIIDVGDIVYTKSPLKKNPYGIIKANLYKTGIVSTLYAVYKLIGNSCAPLFIQYYFESEEIINNYLRPIISKGAKNTINISDTEFLKNIVTFPCLNEQKKITAFFSTFDNKIQKEYEALFALEKQKNGLVQTMFI